MAPTNNLIRVGEALRITAEDLGPWISFRVGVWPPDRRGHVSPHDPAYLAWLLRDQWLGTFSHELGQDTLAVVVRFQDVRNRWAHHEPFTDAEADAAVATCQRLLAAIGSRAPIAPVEPVSAPPTSVSGHRKAAEAEFRQELWNTQFDPHIEPVNRLVDDLIAEKPGSWMPYVAPYHGGTNATIVSMMQDPGKMTARKHGGSGFIGVENDDPTAELMAECMDQAGVAQSAILPWNAYPWYLDDQGNVTAARREQGIRALRRLLAIVPEAHTVVTHGKVAHDTWHRFARQHPAAASRYRHLETFHTSGRGITNGGQQTKAEGVAHVIATLRAAAVPPDSE
jgi:hypothetical protein